MLMLIYINYRNKPLKHLLTYGLKLENFRKKLINQSKILLLKIMLLIQKQDGHRFSMLSMKRVKVNMRAKLENKYKIIFKILNKRNL